MTQTYSGGNIDALWGEGIVISFLQAAAARPGVTVEVVDNSKHSVTMKMDEPSTPIDVSDFAGAQINQNGTKLKTPAEGNIPEMIFTKQ